MLNNLHKHIQSYLLHKGMDPFLLRGQTFHKAHQRPLHLTFYVLKRLRNQHLNPEHPVFYVQLFVMHQLKLLLRFYERFQ